MPALIVALLASPVQAGGPPNSAYDGVLPESSRWISFLRIIEGRWKARTEVLNGESAEIRKQYWACVEDAWFLSSPNMLNDRQGPCVRLVLAQHDGEHESSSSLHQQFRATFTSSPDLPHSAYRSCVTAAAAHGDSDLLPICALAIRPRARLIASLSDDERFGSWLRTCKKVLLTDSKTTQPGSATEGVVKPQRSAEELAEEETQSRHCFRVFPAVYEVKWLKKLSDFWTPEEQRALYLKSQQLGQN